jgi:hypothetical protein
VASGDQSEPIFSTSVVDAVGESTVAELLDARGRVATWCADLDSAWTTEFWVPPVPADKVANWLTSASEGGEAWAYATLTDGGIVAVDEVTEEGMRKRRQAVTYPAL